MKDRTRSHIKLDTNIQHNDKKLVSKAADAVLHKKKISLELSVTDTDELNLTNKPTMVLLHGNSASQKVWQSVVGNLEDTYRVITIDLLGHGDSTKICDLQNLNAAEKELLSAEFYNPLAMAKELEQVFATKNLHDAYVVGWYLGGNLAYTIAEDKPQYISKLLTIGSPPVRFSAEGLKEGFRSWFTQTLIPEWIAKPAKFSEAKANDIAKNLYFENDNAFIEDLKATDPGVRKHLFAKLDDNSPESLDAKKWVLNTKVPLSLMVSKNEEGVNAEYIKSFDGKLKNKASEVKVIKEAGHAFFNEKASCAKNLNRFFSGARKRDEIAETNDKTPKLAM